MPMSSFALTCVSPTQNTPSDTRAANAISPVTIPHVVCAEINFDDIRALANWDEFVATHPYGWICHLSEWKRLLELNFSHLRAHFFGLFEGEKLVAGLPLYEVRSWIGTNKLVSVPFATLNDPLVTSAAQMEALSEYASRLCRQRHCSGIELRTKDTAPLVRKLGLNEINNFKYHCLSLAPGSKALLKSFDRSCVRQRISRAQSSGLTLKIAENAEDFVAFYRQYAHTRMRHGLPSLPRSFVESIWRQLGPSGKVKILLAIYEKQVVAGLLVFKFNGRMSAEILGSDERLWKISPNHFLFWEAIQEACKEGYHVFDFGRTDRDNLPLIDFKARWGTTVSDLPTFCTPDKQIPGHKSFSQQHLLPLASSVIRHMPISFQERLNTIIYRHRY